MNITNKNKLYLQGLLTALIFILLSSITCANKAPDFNLQGDKSIVKLSSYQGKLVYLDFWASWCVPCRQSFPFMNEMKKKYEKEGLKIIAVNLDTDSEKAARFLKIIPAEFSIAYDPQGDVPKAYKVSVVPSLYLINRDGDIVYSHKGFRVSENEKLEARIKQFLSE